MAEPAHTEVQSSRRKTPIPSDGQSLLTAVGGAILKGKDENMERERILIIDREEDSKYLLSLLMERLGYGFRATPDLAEGLSLLENEPFSLVIIEIEHLQAKQLLNIRQSHPHICFIFIGQSMEGLQDHAKPGLSDFLSRPLTPEEAEFRLKRILLERATRIRHDEAERALQTAREELERKDRDLESSMEDLERIKRLYKDIGTELNTTSEKLRRAKDKLELLAITDGLTEVFNHRYFMEQIHESFANARDQMIPLSLLMIDIDHFKTFNDDHGHMTGDFVLREIASILKSSCRKNDLVARYGGEEFAIILPGVNPHEAAKMAERIRSVVENHHLSDGGHTQRVTVSIGIAASGPHIATVNDLISAADRALYRAKAGGRNRVEHGDTPRDLEEHRLPAQEQPNGV